MTSIDTVVPTSSTRIRRDSARIWLGIFLMLAVVLWASAFAAIRVGLDRGYSPQSLALLRFLSASVALAIYAMFKPMRRPHRADLPILAAAALCGITIYHISLNYAEVKVTAGTAGLLIGISPIFAALLAAIFLKERMGPVGWTGTAIAFSGAVVISLGTHGNFKMEPRAPWVLVAALAGALYIVLQKPVLKRYTPLEFVSYTIWLGTLFMMFLFPRLMNEFRTARPQATLAAIYMGVFPAALAYVIWAKVVARLSVSRAVGFLYLVPIWAVIISWLWLGEKPSILALLGGCLVIVGLLFVNRRQRTTSPQ